MDKLRWGVLSTARIGLEHVLPAMQAAAHCEITALASRDLERARAAARQLGIPRVHGSYEALLADPEVDAVYIPLPNHLHVPWSIRALEAGKHVLCEKPIGLDAAQAQELLDAARRHPHLKVMEAFMYRHHPQWQQARRLVVEGRIGELRTVQSFFSFYNVDPANIRNRPEVGGGALMDIGCYCISLARFLFGAEPLRVLGQMERDPAFGTDRLTSGVLDFCRGSATFTCATQLAPYQRVNLLGTAGRVEIEVPFNPAPDQACRLWLHAGTESQEVRFEPVDHYTIQGDLFALAVLHDTPVPTPLEDAVANMRAIDALVQSARDGVWVVASESAA